MGECDSQQNARRLLADICQPAVIARISNDESGQETQLYGQSVGQGTFPWTDCQDTESQISFLRQGRNGVTAVMP